MRLVRFATLVSCALLFICASTPVAKADHKHKSFSLGVSVGRHYHHYPYWYHHGPYSSYRYYSYYPRAYGYYYYYPYPLGHYYYDPLVASPSVANIYLEAPKPRGQSYFQRAETAFRAANYPQAARLARHATVEKPRNGRVFLFLSQALFALGDYPESAQAARQGMALLDASDWGWFVQNFRRYYRNSDYVGQVRQLEEFAAENPGSVDAHFLLGYHYGYLGYRAEAREHLAKARALDPAGHMRAELLAHFGGESSPAPRPAILATEKPEK